MLKTKKKHKKRRQTSGQVPEGRKKNNNVQSVK